MKLGRIGETSARGFAYSYICDMCYSLWLLGCVAPTYIGGAFGYRSVDFDKESVKENAEKYKNWFNDSEKRSPIRRSEISRALKLATRQVK